MEEIKNNKKQIILKWVVILFFIISPLFDTIYFYNKITTLVRILIILILAVFTFILYKDSRKKMLYLLAYYLAMGLYLIISYLHSKGFTSLVPGNFNYSVISEATTLIKLCMPFTLLYILKYQNITQKEFFIVINSWVILVAGSIIACNLCGYSLSSYTDQITNYTIFDWGKNLTYYDTATKGFFAFANQEAVILIMLLLLTFYEFTNNKKYIFLIILILFASLILGTRISTYGGLLILIFISLLYIAHSSIMRQKINKHLIMIVPIILLWIIMLPISPNNNRIAEINENAFTNNETTELEQESDNVEDSSSNTINDEIDSDNDLESKLKYIDENINKNLVSVAFYKENYPYEYDTEFWLDIVNNQSEVALNYRGYEIAIIKRIKEIDNRWTDTIYGISNSRIQNVVNIERDFVLQYYAFGLVGLLLVVMFYIYELIILIKNFIKDKTFLNLLKLIILLVFLLCAYMSGNILNFLAGIIPISFIIIKFNYKSLSESREYSII